MLFRYVDELRYKIGIDFVIANGENSNHGRGMTRACYNEMKRAGVDVFTMGNHVWGAKDIASIMRAENDVLRPANLPDGVPGAGSGVFTAENGVKVGVINLMGQVEMVPCDNPFAAAEREVERLSGITPVIFVDFHAEATSEKTAMGHFLDGRVSAVFGTHTHIQTADSRILPGGTGYITDLGMTGPADSILGMSKTVIINRFRTGMPQRFEIASGAGQFCACVFTVNETGGCEAVERLWFDE